MGDDLPQRRRLEFFATRQLGKIVSGDDLGARIVDAFRKDSLDFATGEILVIAQKIVSKAEGDARSRSAAFPNTYVGVLAGSSPSC